MSTLERLKRSLKLSGASKGLEEVGSAAKGVKLNGISSAVDTVTAKFSALQVMGVTALANITNSAINTGKRMVSALTIDPVKTGFNEYETKINSIQTIMSNTASKGTTMEDVTKVIDELNTYADKTIYNFAEMTRNIGTFTAAGVGLKESASAIQGIANLAAASGSNSQQASTAMYQLSQALATGTVKLMDWNSVVNAGMGGEKFQEALKATAREYGTNVDEIIEANGSFRDSLKDGWLTADVLNTTLNKFTVDGAKNYAKSMMESGKWTQAQADALLKEANAMEDAATKVKTFTQLWDTLKEAAQSGWGKTWELLVGDFEQAKELFSNLSGIFGKIIDDSSNARNKVLEGALTSKWDTFTKKVNKAGISTEDFKNKVIDTAKEHNIAIDDMIKEQGSLENVIKSGKLSTDVIVESLKKFAGATTGVNKSTENMTDKLEYFQKVVNEVWKGNYKNGEERTKALTKAGYDYAQVQSLVNKTVDGHKLTLEDLSDVQLKNIGYTDKQVAKIRKLAEQAEKTGTPLNKLIQDLSKPSGRELLIDSFMNSINGLVKLMGTIKSAWTDVFPPATSEQIYGIIEGLNSFSKHLVMSDETADKLKRTLQGVFSILSIFKSIIGAGFKVGFSVLNKLLGEFDTDLLSVTASIGDAITGFSKWLHSNNTFVKAFDKVISVIANVVKAVVSLVKAFAGIPEVQDKISEMKSNFEGGLKGISDFFNNGFKGIEKFVEKVKAIDSLSLADVQNGFKNLKKNVVDFVKNAGKGFGGFGETVAAFKSNVPSAMESIGNSFDWVKDKIYAFGGFIKEYLPYALSFGLLLVISSTAKKLGDAVQALARPLESFSKVMDSTAGLINSFGKKVKANAFNTKATGIMKLAAAIGILALSIALLTTLDQGKMWSAIGALGVLAAGLVALSFAIEKIGKIGNVSKVSLTILSLSAAMLIIATCLKTMDGLDPGKAIINVGLLMLVAAGLAAVAGLLGKFAPQLSKGSFALIAIATGLKIMIDTLVKMDTTKISNLGGSMLSLLGLAAILALIAKAFQKVKFTSAFSIIAMAVGLKMMIGVLDDIAGMDIDKIKGAMPALITVFGALAAVMIASKFAGKHAMSAGIGIMAISASLIIVIGAMKMLAGMPEGDMAKATSAVTKLLLVFAAVVALSYFAGKNAIKAGVMLVLMAGALLMLTVVIAILKNIEPDGLDRAVGAIATLELLFAGLIAVTKLAQNCKGTLVTLAVVITLLALALVALSAIDPGQLQSAATALTMVIGVFALLVGVTKVLNTAKGSLGKNIAALAGLTLIVGLLGGIILVLSKCDPGSTLEVAASLSLLLMALTASMKLLSGTSGLSIAALGSLAALTLVVAALAVIIGTLAACDVGSTLGIAVSLSVLLISLSAVCAILAAVGMTGPAAFVGIGALVTLIAGVGLLITGLGALVDEFPKLETFLDKGLPLLDKIGYGLGAFFGNMIGGLAAGLTAGMPSIGKDLGDFMTNAQPFFEGAKNVDEGAMKGVQALADTILKLTQSSVIEGLSSWLTGGTSLSDFADELVPFGEGMKKFSDSVDGIKTSAIVNAATAAKTISELAMDLPNSGGFISLLTGDNSLASFADQLVPFGANMKKFSEAVDGVKTSAIVNAATAAKALNEVALAVPNSGGLVSLFTGDNSLGALAKELVPFGTSIKEFSIAAEGVKTSSIINVATAAKSLNDLALALPNSGGLVGLFVGNNDLGDFVKNLIPFGDGLKSFSESATGIKTSAIVNAATAAKSIADVTNALTNSGGFASLISGGISLSSLTSQLTPLGDSMQSFSDSVSNLNAVSIASAATAAEQMVSMINNMATIDSTGVGAFSSAVSQLSGIDMAGVADAFSGYASSMSDAGSSMMDSVASGMRSKEGTLTSTASGIVNLISNTVQSKAITFVASGSALITNLSSGMLSQQGSAMSSVSAVINSAVSTISGYYNSFYSSGSYVVSGFVHGIRDNIASAAAAAASMAKAASDAANAKLDVNSPSKVFYAIGSFSGQGFVNALVDYGKYAYRAGSGLADKAKTGITKSVQKVQDLFNGDLDLQPRIRPVMDLSSVQSGVGAINGMFGKRATIGVSANVSSISSAMNRSRQNGTMSDVVSSINDLKKELTSKGGNTYQINGVTYDDGSNISSAVKSLVRAAKIERRI